MLRFRENLDDDDDLDDGVPKHLLPTAFTVMFVLAIVGGFAAHDHNYLFAGLIGISLFQWAAAILIHITKEGNGA